VARRNGRTQIQVFQTGRIPLLSLPCSQQKGRNTLISDLRVINLEVIRVKMKAYFQIRGNVKTKISELGCHDVHRLIIGTNGWLL
jgi:hypothetical protein